MFLGVDIGNTHTVIGLFRGGKLADSWRIQTRAGTTGDELASMLHSLLLYHRLGLEDMKTVIISSVVPPATEAWSDMTERYHRLTFIDAHEIAVELVEIRYPRAHEVGTDRLLNSLAAFRQYQGACIVVDYGTATTFDCISSRGEYMGGVIAPGIMLAAKSLFTGTSKLPMVKFPRKGLSPLGKSTEEAIQAGLLYGFAGLTDNIISNLSSTFAHDEKPFVISTGGLASVLFDYCSRINRLDPELTMKGLLYCYNHFTKAKS